VASARCPSLDHSHSLNAKTSEKKAKETRECAAGRASGGKRLGVSNLNVLPAQDRPCSDWRILTLDDQSAEYKVLVASVQE